MDVLSFRASLDGDGPPTGVSLPLQALWWDAKGDWDRAHQCAQADDGADGAAVHAYLHQCTLLVQSGGADAGGRFAGG